MEQRKKTRRVSEYGRQLKEKQELKKVYGLREGQMRRIVEEARRMPGNPSENILILLERRFDNIIYRLGFAHSRPHARQLATHGHFCLNNRKVDIPSILLTVGDTVAPKNPKLFDLKNIKPSVSWLDFDATKGIGSVKRLPTREEIDTPIDENTVMQFYSR